MDFYIYVIIRKTGSVAKKYKSKAVPCFRFSKYKYIKMSPFRGLSSEKAIYLCPMGE